MGKKATRFKIKELIDAGSATRNSITKTLNISKSAGSTGLIIGSLLE